MKTPLPKTVSEAIWPWRAADKPDQHPPNAWTRALIQAMVISIVAGIFFYKGHMLPAVILWVLAALIFAGSILWPKGYWKLDHWGRRFGKAVGILLAWMLLTPFYYLCLWPCAMIAKKRLAHDFSRNFSPDTSSYWIHRKSSEQTQPYKRQY